MKIMKIGSLIFLSQLLLAVENASASKRRTIQRHDSDAELIASIAKPSTTNLRVGGSRRLSKKEQRQKRRRKRHRKENHKLNIFRRPTRNANTQGKNVNRKQAKRLMAYLRQIKASGVVDKAEIEERFHRVFHMSVQEVVFAIGQNVSKLNNEEIMLLQFLQNVVVAINSVDNARTGQALGASSIPSIPGGGGGGASTSGSNSGRASRTYGSGGYLMNTATTEVAYDHDHALPDLVELAEEVALDESSDSPSSVPTTYPTPTMMPASYNAAMALDFFEDDDDADDDDADDDDTDDDDYNDDDDEVDDDNAEDDDDSTAVISLIADTEIDGTTPTLTPSYLRPSATPTLSPTSSSSDIPSDIPSSTPSQVPTTNSTLKPLAKLEEDDGTSIHWLGECEGDCDYNSDCNIGLVCGWRDHEGDDDGIGVVSVHGCSLDPRQVGTGSEDFCHKPPTSNTLVITADRELDLGMENYPLDKCQGDCWDDEDCMGGLVCVFFDDDRKDVASCVGWAEETYSYCLEP